jgi:hypothetical protein
MGFMVVDAPPGEREVRLAFVTPLENRLGRALTVITLILLTLLILAARFMGRERRS